MRCALLWLTLALGCRFYFDPAASDGGTDGGGDSLPNEATVQRGTTSLTAGVASVSVPIEPVDPTHAILVFSASAATFDPNDGLVAGSLSAAGVTFSRAAGSARPVTI